MTISTLRWSTILIVLATFPGLTGCLSVPDPPSSPDSSSETRSLSSSRWETQHAQLLQRGRFSDAALLAGLHTHQDLEVDRQGVRASEDHPGHGTSASSPLRRTAPSSTPEPTGEHHDGKANPEALSESGWHSRMGWQFLINGNYKGAVAAYREALRRNDRSPEAFLGLGIALRLQGRVTAAKSAIRRALSLDPRYAAALVHLGYIYADSSHADYAKARQLFRLASQQGDPFAAIALRDLDARERT